MVACVICARDARTARRVRTQVRTSRERLLGAQETAAAKICERDFAERGVGGDPDRRGGRADPRPPPELAKRVRLREAERLDRELVSP